MRWKNNTFLSLIFLITVFFVTHVPKLGYDEINPDAINWHQRSEQYVDAIKSRDFKRTYQHYHPGVTLMFIIGPPVELFKRVEEPRLIYNRYTYEVFHFLAKYTLNMVLLSLIVICVFLLSKVIPYWAAYLAGVLLTVDPFFLGNSRLLHMDALLSLFLICSLTSLFISLKKKSLNWMMATGIFLGLSFWTKNISILAILFSCGILLLLFLFKKVSAKFTAASLFLIILGFIVVGYSLLPALWVDPERVFTKIYGGSRVVVDEGHTEKFFGVISDNPGPWYYPLVLLFKISPHVLIFFCAGSLLLLTGLLKRPKLFLNSSPKMFLIFLLLFFAGYFLAVEIANKKIDRYLLPLFPIIYCVAAYYFYLLLSYSRTKLFFWFMSGVLLIAALHPVFVYFPYYFVYNSPLFGGNTEAEYVIGQKSFGVGIFEVREYILKHYGFIKVGFVDRKPISAIYPSSMVVDARVESPDSYEVLVLDSDEIPPKKTQGKFVLDKSIQISGVNFWNFYVKKPQ